MAHTHQNTTRHAPRRAVLSQSQLEYESPSPTHFCPDEARYGYRWAYGALVHRSGPVFLQTTATQTTATRDTASWLHFLDGLEPFAPPGGAYLMVDGLPLHWSVDTMLWDWGHPRFHFVPLPKAAAWLNRIEGFWKIHTADRKAHFEINVELILAPIPDSYLDVRDGTGANISRQQISDIFTDSFVGTTYHKWDDMEPPVIHISADGTMAWMVDRVKVRPPSRAYRARRKKKRSSTPG